MGLEGALPVSAGVEGTGNQRGGEEGCGRRAGVVITKGASQSKSERGLWRGDRGGARSPSGGTNGAGFLGMTDRKSVV